MDKKIRRKPGPAKRLHQVAPYKVYLEIDDAEWAKAQTQGMSSLCRVALKHLRYRLETGSFKVSEDVNG